MMHKDEAGMPTAAPRDIRVAANKEAQSQFVGRNERSLQISHQIGARLMASLAQTTELTNWFRQVRATQIM